MSQESDKVLGSNDKSLGTFDKPRRQNRKKVMSAVLEAREHFREAFPQYRFGKLENVFYEAVRFISPRVEKPFTLRRARSIYEGTARRIDSDEMDAIREAVFEEHKREQQEIRTRLASLDKKIAAFDAVSARQTLAGGR